MNNNVVIYYMDFSDLALLLKNHKWEKNNGYNDQKSKNWRNGEYSLNVGYNIRIFEKGRPLMPSRHMVKDDRIYKECKRLFPDFPFNAVQINKNVLCPPHRDTYNIGDSLIFSLGEFSGGRLMVEGEGIDIHENPYIFNGNKLEHWTEPWFDGDRYSVVLFLLRKH
tara:strand:- start:1251 stop:1748 length:498 start_codon:yes stop_codon:yes gene_type:complete